MAELSAVENSIKHCIEKNGFPEKSVRLPFKSIHESCKNHRIALKEVLANLIQHKIFGTIQGDFIEFRARETLKEKPNTSNHENNPSKVSVPNMEDLKEMAQSYMSKMTPDQIQEMEKTVSNMSEEERGNILKNFSTQFFKNKP
jgi:hypothetical protein